MSKKLKNLKWNTVALEGFPASVTDNLQGFVGLEECTTYGLDKERKLSKKVCVLAFTFLLYALAISRVIKCNSMLLQLYIFYKPIICVLKV